MNIRYELLPESQQKKLPADQSSLGFGNLRTNHMFVMDYKNGEWQDQRIIPYAPFTDITPGVSHSTTGKQSLKEQRPSNTLMENSTPSAMI